MKYSEACKAASEGKPVFLLDLDTTRSWSVNHVCKLADGELVMAHPTDPGRGNWIAAPKNGNYALGNQAEIDKDSALEEQNAQEMAREDFDLES